MAVGIVHGRSCEKLESDLVRRETELRREIDKMRTRMEQIADQHKVAITELLSLRGMSLICELEQECGSTVEDRDYAQSRLRELAGTAIVEPFARALGKFLRQRKWGIEADSGIPASFYWNRKKSLSHGGYARLAFRDGNKNCTEGCFTKMPAGICLVSKTDLRSRKNKKG
jgi:hypothetical protein